MNEAIRQATKQLLEETRTTLGALSVVLKWVGLKRWRCGLPIPEAVPSAAEGGDDLGRTTPHGNSSVLVGRVRTVGDAARLGVMLTQNVVDRLHERRILGLISQPRRRRFLAKSAKEVPDLRFNRADPRLRRASLPGIIHRGESLEQGGDRI